MPKLASTTEEGFALSRKNRIFLSDVSNYPIGISDVSSVDGGSEEGIMDPTSSSGHEAKQ